MKNSKVINIFFSIFISIFLFLPSSSLAESVDSCSVVSGSCANHFTVYTTNSGGAFVSCPNPRFAGYYCGNANYINCNDAPTNPYSNPNDANCTGHYSGQYLPQMQPVGDGTYVNCPVHPNDPACVTYCQTHICGNPSLYNNGGYSDDELNTDYRNSDFNNYDNQSSGSQNQNGYTPVNNNNVPTQPQTFNLENPLGPDLNSAGDVIQKGIEIFTYTAVLFAVLAFIWVGFKFIVAQGNAEKIKESTRHFWYLIIGVSLVIGARVIMEIVINTLDASGVVNPSTIQSTKDALGK